MAKGYITPTDRGLTATDVDIDTHVMIDARLPVQPSEWESESGLQRYRIQASRQLSIDAGKVVTEHWVGWDGYSGVSNETGVLAAVWKDYDGTGSAPAEPTGSDLTKPVFSSTNAAPRHAFSPGDNEAYLKFETDDVNTEILAICLEMENDNAIATSDPATTQNYETIGRNTGTWCPYEDNMSCNAWLLQRPLAQNLNKVLYETKQYWTVPL